MSTYFDRTVSAFPLSIGTSIAFESLFAGRQTAYDPERPVTHFDVSDYGEFQININTLIRNIIGSLNDVGFKELDQTKVFNTLVEEVEMIRSILINEGSNHIKPVFYKPRYVLPSVFSNRYVNLRIPKTEKQLKEESVRLYCAQTFLKEHKEDDVVTYNAHPHPLGKEIREKNAIILTHVPYDLLGEKHFKELVLLESHTGAIKKKELWYTKYYKGKEMRPMPFTRKLLAIFGDMVMFSPMLSAYRDIILDAAEKGRWTVFTTEDKIRQDLDLYVKERFLVKQVYASI